MYFSFHLASKSITDNLELNLEKISNETTVKFTFLTQKVRDIKRGRKIFFQILIFADQLKTKKKS
jgi:hypothetical protein